MQELLRSLERAQDQLQDIREQGRRNSIISGEATSNIANFFALFPQKLVCQPLISGEAGASPVPTPLSVRETLNQPNVQNEPTTNAYDASGSTCNANASTFS